MSIQIRTKPIEAIQYTGDNFEEIHKFTNKSLQVIQYTDSLGNYLIIETRKYHISASPGDWLTLDFEGQLFAISPETLEKYYEVAHSSSSSPFSSSFSSTFRKENEYDPKIRIDADWLLEEGWKKDGDFFLKGKIILQLSRDHKEHPRPLWFASFAMQPLNYGPSTKDIGFSTWFDTKADLKYFEQQQEEVVQLREKVKQQQFEINTKDIEIFDLEHHILNLELPSEKTIEEEFYVTEVLSKTNADFSLTAFTVGFRTGFVYCNELRKSHLQRLREAIKRNMRWDSTSVTALHKLQENVAYSKSINNSEKPDHLTTKLNNDAT